MGGIILIATFVLLSMFLVTKKFNDAWLTHLIINLVFYGFYAFLIYHVETAPPKEHRGNPGLGLAMVIFGTAPLLILYNIISIIIAYINKQNTILAISFIGLAPILFVFIMITNGLFGST